MSGVVPYEAIGAQKVQKVWEGVYNGLEVPWLLRLHAFFDIWFREWLPSRVFLNEMTVRSKHESKLLTATALDGIYGIFPLAFAFVARIWLNIMEFIHKRRVELDQWESKVTPSLVDKLQKEWQYSNNIGKDPFDYCDKYYTTFWVYMECL
ncbi:hypothetical protein LINGRAHAP2_LOCUS19928 [Linum grandiflorum]